MSTDSGFIALHRSLINWEWYTDTNTKSLFIHCLLKANWKDKNYRGKIVKRGQFLTSRDILAKETGLSIKNIRTAIKHLKATNEVAIESSRQGTVITVINYDQYQKGANETASEVANKGPTGGQRGASTNKDNNKNKEKNSAERIKVEDLDYSKWPGKPSKEFLDEWVGNRKEKKLKYPTQRVVDLAGKGISEAVEAGYSFEQCLDRMEKKGWASFEFEWMKNAKVVPIEGGAKQRLYNRTLAIAKKTLEEQRFYWEDDIYAVSPEGDVRKVA